MNHVPCLIIIAILLFVMGGLFKTILGFSEGTDRIVGGRGIAMHHIVWTIAALVSAYTVWLIVRSFP